MNKHLLYFIAGLGGVIIGWISANLVFKKVCKKILDKF